MLSAPSQHLGKNSAKYIMCKSTKNIWYQQGKLE